MKFECVAIADLNMASIYIKYARELELFLCKKVCNVF